MIPIKISVITVCFNAARLLPATMESVLMQDCTDYEYVIEDGESTDDTQTVVAGYIDRFREKGINCKYIRKSDEGIYDAMNKAVEAASGEYICFMNAGDCFYNTGVLKHISGIIGGSNDTKPSVIYGDCVVYEHGEFHLFGKKIGRMETAMPFSHQSAFARADILREHPFNTSYRYSADYDFLLTVRDIGGQFTDSGIVVCITTADGVSSVNYHDTLMESVLIQKAHGIDRYTPAGLAKKDRELRIKQFVLDHFPDIIKKQIRKVQIKKRGQGFEAVIPPWFNI
ncbi:MAG: glycosyltransferase [Lachnospiraceae bacterium]|nr:glycosyltransferase [Lachnospiraceae bacterium]